MKGFQTNYPLKDGKLVNQDSKHQIFNFGIVAVKTFQLVFKISKNLAYEVILKLR